MNPKAQEYATVVWAVWDLASIAFYVPVPDGVNNVHGFYGKFEVALDYNDGDVAATTDLADQAIYSFPAIVKKLTAQQSATRKVNAHTGGGTALHPRRFISLAVFFHIFSHFGLKSTSFDFEFSPFLSTFVIFLILILCFL